MEYEEIKQLKQSAKSTVYLVHEKDKEQVYIKKILKGQRHVYEVLQDCEHPFLPKLYEVTISDDTTTIIEEYIEGRSLGNVELSEKQFLNVVKELCSVLEFVHGKGIIHRDIKPSNIIFAQDGHIRLIDFDAARMPKDDLEQDTMLLGTRGYAPPEQYGFAQTDERTDIYSLGITLKQILGDKAQKLRYKRIIQKCTNLNPRQRFQSIRRVRRAFFQTEKYVVCSVAVFLVMVVLWIGIFGRSAPQENAQSGSGDAAYTDSGLVILPAPENPHWDGETGIGVWGNVPDSGVGGEVGYKWRLYRLDEEISPDPGDEDTYIHYGDMGGNWNVDDETSTYAMNMVTYLEENGFYYFTVSAIGDGVHYADSPYVVSDAFLYTGESAPPLPTPTGLMWKTAMNNDVLQYYAICGNLDDYADKDSFNVRVYSQSGTIVVNNIWTKEQIMSVSQQGIWISPDFIEAVAGPCRFTIQVSSSRPNEYKTSLMPDPIPEEYFSPWLMPGSQE